MSLAKSSFRTTLLLRQLLDKFLTWYFDLLADGGATGAQRLWRLEASWDWQTPPVIGFLAAMVGVVVWLSMVISRRQSTAMKTLILSVRLLTFLLAVLLFVQVRLKTIVYARPKLAILLDTSSSMSLTDRYEVEDRKLLHRIGFTDSSSSRLELMQELFTTRSPAGLSKTTRQFDIDLYTFDSSLHPMQELSSKRANFDSSNELPIFEAIAQLNATGVETDIKGALEELSRTDRGRPPVAVVLISDGNPTAHSKTALSGIEKTLRRMHTPVFSIGIGSRRNSRDLIVEEIGFEAVGFAGEDHPISVATSTNKNFSEQVTLIVRNLTTKQDVTTIVIEELDKQRSSKTRIVLPDLASGRNDFEIEAVPLAGETNLQNNVRRIRVWGRDSDLNVLLIDRTPRWEYRHLKSALERDPHLSVRTFLTESDHAHALEDRTALSRFPKSLAEYDALILGDVDFNMLDSEFAEEVKTFVQDNSGGLLLLSGGISLRTLDLTTAIADLHPAIIGSPPDEDRLPVTVAISAEGRAQDVLPAGMEQSEFEKLPEVYPIAREFSTKAASLVLLQTQQAEQTLPLILSMRYGSGLIVQHLFDDTWRWRAINDGEFYRKLWSQIIRNLCRRRLLDQLPAFDLLADRDQYQSHEAVQIRLIDRQGWFQDRDSVSVDINKNAESANSVELNRSEAAENSFTKTFEQLAPGEYSLSLTTGNVDLPVVRTQLSVVESHPEAKYLPMNEDLLRNLSQSTQGEFFYPWESELLLKQLPNRKMTNYSESRVIPLWNRWEFVLLISALLAVEWIARRRSGIE